MKEKKKKKKIIFIFFLTQRLKWSNILSINYIPKITIPLIKNKIIYFYGIKGIFDYGGYLPKNLWMQDPPA